MRIKFKKLAPNAIIPSYAKQGDAGLDLTAIAHTVDSKDHYIQYHTGLAVEIPEGYVGLIYPRSSNSKTDLRLANCVGVIDSGYRGEICFRYKFPITKHFTAIKRYLDGDRIGQLIIMPYPTIEPEEVSELSNTVRGEGGFGSTGD
ncbi:MAG: dUTP diphosphatase [Pelagibacterales bacterium]|nr:dUTP diphosphatase [Pelagibacterales bacterium]